jgi:hypothetical protein
MKKFWAFHCSFNIFVEKAKLLIFRMYQYHDSFQVKQVCVKVEHISFTWDLDPFFQEEF